MNNKVKLASLSLTLAMIIFLAYLFGRMLWSERLAQLREADTAVRNMAGALAQQAATSFKLAEALLLELSGVNTSDMKDHRLITRSQRIFSEQLTLFSEIDSIVLIGEKGQWLVNWPTQKLDIDSSDRDYFLFHKSQRGDKTRIGAPIKSRLTGDWVIPISRRIEDNGKFIGVALVTLRVNHFLEFYRSFDIGKQGALLLGTNEGEGMILLRRPFETQFLGKSLASSPLYQANFMKEAAGNLSIVSSQDAIARFAYFQRVDNYPLFVVAALGQEEVLKSWKSGIERQLTIFSLMLLAMSYLGHRLVKQIRLRNAAEKEVAIANTTLSEMNSLLKKQALIDGMTGISNRRHLDEETVKAIQLCALSNKSLAFIMLDVDHFKKFNDLFGHIQGDMCLRDIAGVLQTALRRSSDLAARYGGEEFSILLVDTDLVDAHKIAEGILYSIRELQIPHPDNKTGYVTASAGVFACIPGLSVTPDEIFYFADKALYAAKNAGRNQVCDFSETNRKSGRRLSR